MLWSVFVSFITFMGCLIGSWEEALIPGTAQDGPQQPHSWLTCLSTSVFCSTLRLAARGISHYALDAPLHRIHQGLKCLLGKIRSLWLSTQCFYDQAHVGCSSPTLSHGPYLPDPASHWPPGRGHLPVATHAASSTRNVFSTFLPFKTPTPPLGLNLNIPCEALLDMGTGSALYVSPLSAFMTLDWNRLLALWRYSKRKMKGQSSARAKVSWAKWRAGSGGRAWKDSLKGQSRVGRHL